MVGRVRHFKASKADGISSTGWAIVELLKWWSRQGLGEEELTFTLNLGKEIAAPNWEGVKLLQAIRKMIHKCDSLFGTEAEGDASPPGYGGRLSILDCHDRGDDSENSQYYFTWLTLLKLLEQSKMTDIDRRYPLAKSRTWCASLWRILPSIRSTLHQRWRGSMNLANLNISQNPWILSQNLFWTLSLWYGALQQLLKLITATYWYRWIFAPPI